MSEDLVKAGFAAFIVLYPLVLIGTALYGKRQDKRREEEQDPYTVGVRDPRTDSLADEVEEKAA